MHSGAPAFFEALETEVPDLVILDWNLPTLSGGEVLQRLRLDERTHRLRIFILSHPPKGHHAAEAVSRLGALGWLEKVRTTPAELANVSTRRSRSTWPAPSADCLADPAPRVYRPLSAAAAKPTL